MSWFPPATMYGCERDSASISVTVERHIQGLKALVVAKGVPQRGDPTASPPEDRTFVLPPDELAALKNLREMEAAAYSLLPYTSRAMIEYGSEDDETVRNNAGAWSKYALVP